MRRKSNIKLDLKELYMYFCFIFMFLILLLEWFYKLSRQFSPAGLLTPQDGDRKWRNVSSGGGFCAVVTSGWTND